MGKVFKFVGIVTLAVLALGAAGLNAANRISFTFGQPRFRFNWNNIGQFIIDIPLSITNNNPIALPVQRLEAVVFYSNEPIASVRIDQPFTIAANGTSTSTVQALVPVTGVAQSLYNIITTGTFIGTLNIRGYLYAADLAIPFDQPIRVA